MFLLVQALCDSFHEVGGVRDSGGWRENWSHGVALGEECFEDNWLRALGDKEKNPYVCSGVKAGWRNEVGDKSEGLSLTHYDGQRVKVLWRLEASD